MKNKIKCDGILCDQIEIEGNYVGRLYGPEIEIFTVDENLNPLNIINKFDSPNIKPELTSNQLEITTAPYSELCTIEQELNSTLYDALETAEKYDALLFPAALHPTQSNFEITQNNRYYTMLETLGPAARLNAPRVTALQINVGGKNVKDAFETHNRLREILPILTGLAVASPFKDGICGNKSQRNAVYIDTVSRYPDLAGFPKKLNNLKDYTSEIQNLPVFQHPNSYYKFLRPMPMRGVAAEIRPLDMQPSIPESMAFIAAVKGYLASNINLENLLVASEFYRATREGIYDKVKFKKTLDIAKENLPSEEKCYLNLLYKRLKCGTVADKLIRRTEKNGIIEAHLELTDSLARGKPYV